MEKVYKFPQKLLVDRSIWRYADAPEFTGNTYLLNKKGYMCCLGQICRQMGIPDDKLYMQGFPAHLLMNIPQLVVIKPNQALNSYRFSTDSEKWKNSPLALKAMEINDAEGMHQEDRENDLIRLFKDYNIELEFFGEYPPSLETEELNA